MMARYDRIAASYASPANDLSAPAVNALLELTGPVAGLRVLDLACGDGVLARELARRGAAVTGLDLSSELLARARRHDPEAATPVRYVLGNVASPDVLDGDRFEIVVCNFGLSDIDDLDGACATVDRLVAPKGRFVFSILHPCFAGTVDVSGSWPTGHTYFDEGWWKADGQLSTLRREVGANHRTLSTYLNTLRSHNLWLDQLCEPRPEQRWAAECPSAAQQPVYVVARCHPRPAG
jgi:2-polyprenyl-3-methyl-5-hydroxy-6-metoxy-1,4-benzoquinol methylase